MPAMMITRPVVGTWLWRRARSGGETGTVRWSAHAAAALLSWRLRLHRGAPPPWLVRAVTEVMCLSRDVRVSERARQALERRCDDGAGLDPVLAVLSTGGSARVGPDRLFTAAATGFLFAPAPSSTHEPRVRLVEHLCRDEAGLTAPSRPTPSHLGRWLVRASLTTADDEARIAGAAVLRTTDEPHLLEALEDAFREGVGHIRSTRHTPRADLLESRVYRLWDGGRPTLLTQIIEANHELPVAPARAAGGAVRPAEGVLLALLKRRPAVVEEYLRYGDAREVVHVLVEGTGLDAPPALAEGCRHVLRTLPSGVAQEEVCLLAVAGYLEAKAAAVDAGYLPAAADVPAFLFATEQWDRYDEADPDGRLLREWCEKATLWSVERIRDVADENGRPDPRPDPPSVPRRSGREGHGPSSTFAGGHVDTGGGGAGTPL